MEWEEIYSLTISPPIISKFAVQWSEDNHISIITEKGIHIFEFVPSPMSPHSTMKFSRSFVYAPSIFPTEVISNRMEAKIWGMHREAVYSFMMEENLTPKMSNVRETVPRIVDLAWSPHNLIHPSKCLLGIITSTGAIMVVHKLTADWYPAYDLCSVRYDAVEEEINAKLKDGKSDSVSASTLKNCMKMLQASCMAWSELLVDFAYLAVAYHNGDIIVYKLPRISDHNEISSPKIVGTLQLNECAKINALHWIAINIKEYLIIVGYFDGRIYGVRIKEHDQIFKLESVEKYYDYVDRISVSSVTTIPQTGSDIKVLVSKGIFLFLLCFTTKGIIKSTQHLQLEGFMVSGVTCTSADSALVTTENSSVFVIDTRNDQFLKTKVKNGLSQTHVRYLGLAHSLSCAMFINVTTPNTLYDHLVMKEPSKMCIFRLKSENPSDILQRSKRPRFEQLWDLLEVIRIKAIKAVDSETVLPKVPSNLEFLSLYELRIAMWISVIMDICEKKKVIPGIGSIAGEISEVQPLIFIHTACNYLELLQTKSSLLEEQKLSMNLLRMYLDVYLAGEENEEASPLSRRARDVLQKISRFALNNIESCNLCGEAINDLSWKVTKCPQGHILPRCAITLLQITTTKYRMCPICGLLFHPCLDQEFEETRCLFCDVPAVHENRVLGFESYMSTEKSLSRLRVCVPEVLQEREVEAVADES